MTVTELTPETARRFGFQDAGGAVISDVRPLGPAARRGVARGWKITEIDGRRVSDAADATRRLEAVEPGEIVSLLVEDPEGNSRIVNVRAGG